MEHIDRILSDIGIDGIIDALSSKNLNWSDFHTLLLKILEKRVERITPTEVMRNYASNHFSQISCVNQRDRIRVDNLIYDVLPSIFCDIELSPATVTGANSALTRLEPKVVLSTIRNIEVVGDSSMALAIECAHRKKMISGIRKNTDVHLATSHRLLRLQKPSCKNKSRYHFGSFALASAGIDCIGFNKFELESISTHIGTWIEVLIASSKIGYDSQNVSVAISDVRLAKKLIECNLVKLKTDTRKYGVTHFTDLESSGINLPNTIINTDEIIIPTPEIESCIKELQFTDNKIVKPLREKYPNVNFFFDLSKYKGIGYYSGLHYQLSAHDTAGNKYSLAGGGACDWTRKLLSNKKEHLVTSGFGTETFIEFFKKR